MTRHSLHEGSPKGNYSTKTGTQIYWFSDFDRQWLTNVDGKLVVPDQEHICRLYQTGQLKRVDQ